MLPLITRKRAQQEGGLSWFTLSGFSSKAAWLCCLWGCRETVHPGWVHSRGHCSAYGNQEAEEWEQPNSQHPFLGQHWTPSNPCKSNFFQLYVPSSKGSATFQSHNDLGNKSLTQRPLGDIQESDSHRWHMGTWNIWSFGPDESRCVYIIYSVCTHTHMYVCVYNFVCDFLNPFYLNSCFVLLCFLF